MTGCCGCSNANLREHFHPILVGQGQVEQNHIECALPDLHQAISTACRDDDGVAFELQKSFQRLPDFRFVVNDENSARAFRERAFRSAAARDRRYFRHC